MAIPPLRSGVKFSRWHWTRRSPLHNDRKTGAFAITNWYSPCYQESIEPNRRLLSRIVLDLELSEHQNVKYQRNIVAYAKSVNIAPGIVVVDEKCSSEIFIKYIYIYIYIYISSRRLSHFIAVKRNRNESAYRDYADIDPRLRLRRLVRCAWFFIVDSPLLFHYVFHCNL